MFISTTKRIFLLSIFLLTSFLSCGPKDSQEIKETPVQNDPLTNYVDVFIGTERGESEHPGARGNTHPGATVPWGMVAASPQSFDFSSKHLATGYRDAQDSIYGFSCVNFSGVGCPAAGSVPIRFSSGRFNMFKKGSKYTEQVAKPGYYSVDLVDHQIKVETSTTTRSVIFKLHLPRGESNIYFDLSAQQGHIKGGEVLSHTNASLSGYQLEGFFCGADTKSKTFFHAELEQEADTTRLVYGKLKSNKLNQNLKNKPTGLVYTFYKEVASVIQLKVGVSFVSELNAKTNLEAEQPDYNFKKIVNQANATWEKELGKIRITTDQLDDKITFYTALYHSLLMPITFNDTNGEYIKQGSEHEVGKVTDHIRYTGFSLWDTYRTLHPLLTLVYPEVQVDMVKTMLGMYRESGHLPKWEIFGQEPNIMVGDPAAIVIADTYVKGIRNFDTEYAFNAMKHQAEVTEGNFVRRGLKEYLDLGYISMDGEFSDVANFQWKNGVVWGAVSTTMEFNLADYGIAQMAKGLGKQQDYTRYLNRSYSFLNLYDAQYGMLRPKNKDGSWYTPFDPTQELWDKMNFGLRGGPGFVEGSAWQYLYSIPHGIDSLISIMGRDRFENQLDELFEKEYFDMTNQPGLGFPFMYNYTENRNSKTPQRVHDCLQTYFRNAHNGLPGNDDAGTMSAWVVFAMMGLYPDTPGSPDYMVTTPTVEEVKIKLNTEYYKGDGIRITRFGSKNAPIQSIELNDSSVKYKINHLDLTGENSVLEIHTSE